MESTLKDYQPFIGRINQWNGLDVYVRQKNVLDKQINDLISLQGGLAQSSQGMPEDWEYRKILENDVVLLQESIKRALGIV